MATPALIAATAFAVLDWYAVATERRELEHLAKPAALGSLAIYAALSPAPSAWLLSALVLSLLGDVYLMLPGPFFPAGLAAFLLAHVAYIGAFDAPVPARVLWLAAVLAVSAPATMRILRAAPAGPLRVAVGAYVTVISVMVASAIASGSLLAAAGALLFFLSDALIAWNRFVTPFAWARVAIIVTYHVGQLGLVLALRG